jgi:hypothetical protein
MQCENANAMRKSKTIRIASLLSFKKTGKIIDRSLFRICIALPALLSHLSNSLEVSDSCSKKTMVDL